MSRPKDCPPNFWHFLVKGLYALRSELSSEGVYNQDWAFVLEDDGAGGIEMVYEEADGVPFLVTEELT